MVSSTVGRSLRRCPRDDETPIDRATLAARDAADPLSALRAAWDVPDGLVHLDGNSLGPPARTWGQRMAREHAAWRDLQIRSWNDADWVGLPRVVASRLAPLLGAHEDEVAVTDSTSVNLFQAAVAARRLRPDRRVLLTEVGTFPTDRYVLDAVAALVDAEVRAVPRASLLDELASPTADQVAVVAVAHVDFRTGHRHDAAVVTAAAHAAGALMVWDLAHSTGALHVDWHGWDADLGVGCTYKFLNGGPGAPGYLVAARRLHEALLPAIRGWFGHATPFAFDETWTPAAGATRFLNGTPPVLSLLGVDEALQAFAGVDTRALDARAGMLTSVFVELVDERCPGTEVVSPRDPTARGAQVSLRHTHAYELVQALIDRDVLADHRPPDVARFGFAPALVRHVDVYDAAERLASALAEGAHLAPRYAARRTVP